MLRIVGSTLSLVGSGRRSLVPATNGSQRVGGCNPVLTCIPTVTRSPKTEPKVTVICNPKIELKVAKKFKRKSSIPIQICLSKNDNIQIHQYIEMSQDLNPSTCSYLVIFMYWAMGMRKPHFQCNANREVATTFCRFCNQPHVLHVIFVKVVPGTTSHCGSKQQ